MSDFRVGLALKDHVARIAKNMRPEDAEEVWASDRQTPEEALLEGLERSDLCWTGFVDDRPAMMFGVAPLTILAGQGAPWLLGTNEVLKVKKKFILECGHYISKMSESYPHLINFVDARNKISIRWLGRMGFEIKPPIPIGRDGEMFHPFEMRS